MSKNSKRHINSDLFKKENKYRVVADFIAGMTDRYAINLHKIIKWIYLLIIKIKFYLVLKI